MKRLIFIFGLFLSFALSAQNYWYTKPTTSSLAADDILLIYQSGATKNFTVTTLSNFVNDTADVLRAELEAAWRTEIGDTSAVIRALISSGATVDTAFYRVTNIVYLRVIGDSVGIGTADPGEKLEVSGNVKAIRAIFDNGYTNTLIGDSSGASLTSGGNNNIFIGDNAGQSATSSDKTIIIGNDAGDEYTSAGSYNVILGHEAATTLTAAAYSTIIGYQAGSTTDQLNNSTAIGYQALGAGATSIFYSTAIGSRALLNSTGSYNVGLGYDAGGDITGGSNNTFIGGGSGSTVNGVYDGNTFIGMNAGKDADANYSTAIGVTAGYQNDQDGSTTVGFASGLYATGAAGFTAVGYQAGYALTTGDNNTLIGSNAGNSLTTGSNNTLIGEDAGEDLTTHSGNVMIGQMAGEGSTVSNQLFIDNSDDATPLIWGDFSADSIVTNGDHTVTGILSVNTAAVIDSQLVVDQSVTGTASNPSLAFGDGDAGFYESSDDQLRVSLVGADKYAFLTSGFTMQGGSSTGYWELLYETSSSSNPNIIPSKADLNTGIGQAGADALSLISGGVEGLRITESGGVITVLATDTLRSSDYAGGPLDWAVESDSTKKKNITDLKNPLRRVMNLRGVNYVLKTDSTGKKRMGFIAQEALPVIPEAVEGTEGNYSIAYGQVTALLTEAMQSQQRQIRWLYGIVVVLVVVIVHQTIRYRRIYMRG